MHHNLYFYLRLNSYREYHLSLARAVYVGWKTWSANRNTVFSSHTRWVPESARWLIATGKVKQAHRHLLRCARMNGRKDFAVSPEVRNWRSWDMFFLSSFLSLFYFHLIPEAMLRVQCDLRAALQSTGYVDMAMCHVLFYSRNQLRPILKIKQ